MVLMSSVEDIRVALGPHAAKLHQLARLGIRDGFGKSAPPSIALHDCPPPLHEQMASFVTLRLEGSLRGCVGTPYAERPLAEDLTRNAFLAAFHDARFSPLALWEFSEISIDVSVLSPPEPLPFTDEDDLAANLVPGRDGLILEYEGARGLFLPQVWDMLPDACVFLDHLKDKAGIPPGPLGPTVHALRFEAIKFSDDLCVPGNVAKKAS